MKKRLLSLLLCAMCVLAAHSEVQYILNEGFESGIPATWTQQVLSTNTQNWVSENSDLTYPDGAFQGTGRAAFRNITGTTQDYVTRLITPVLNLPYGSQYQLKFAYAAAAWSGSVDSLTVYYSTDGGAHWTVHTGFGTMQNSWKEVTLDLIGNGSNYQLAFEAFDRLGHGIVLDAVRVLAKSDCADVENFAADAHANSVDLSWNGDFGATFQLIVDTVSHELAALDPAGQYLHYEATQNDAVNVSGLLPEHTYYAYVRSLCADNESGFTEWQAVEFRTAIGFPYQPNLSSMPAGWQIMYGALDAQPQPNTSSYKWFQTTSAAFGAHVYAQTYYTYSGGAQYLPDWFISPAIDISSLAAGSPVELTFSLSISSSSTLMTDLTSNQGTSNFYVMVSTDGGESWSEAKVCPATSYASAWRRVRVNLTEYTGVASSVKVALVAHSSSTSVYFHVKDIKIDSFDAQCGDVQSVKATNVTTNSAKLVWTLVGKDDVVVEISKNATFATILSSDTLHDASHELVLSSLDNSTTYYVRAKQLCEDAEWAIGSFTTLFGMPFSENFDALTSAEGIPAGWDNSEGTMTSSSYNWNYYATGRTGHGLRMNSYSASSGQYNVLATPIILVDDVDSKFSFDYKNSTGGPLEVFYSIDNGATRVALDSLGTASSWETHTYIMPSTVRNTGVQFFFKGTSNYGNGDAYLNLDNVMLKEYDPNCTGLVSLMANAEINDAVIAWTIGGSTHEALVLVSSQANFSDTVALAAVSGVDTLLVEGLEANTKYYVRAIQNCGGFTMADALSLNFKTHCEPDTIPYIMGFEDETSAQDPNCWTIVRKSGNYPYAYQGASYAHDGTKSFYYGSGSTQQRSTAALPAFDQPVNGLEMSFWLRAYSASCTNTLEVGVMTNPLDTNTFVRIASFQPKSATYEEQLVSFNSYKGTGKYIAFRNAATGNYGFCIDDINVHVLPTCYAMGEVVVNNITGQGATLQFAPTNADNYQVVVATEAINIDSLETAAVQAVVVYNQVVDGSTGEIVLDDAAIFPGNTLYYIYVRGVCSENEQGKWSKQVSFKTNCRPFTPAEFGTETFSDANAMACWDFGFTTEGTSTSYAYATPTTVTGFGKVVKLSKESANSTSYTYNDGAYAVTPEFAVGDSINKFQISFSAATNSTAAKNQAKLVVGVVSSLSDISTKEDVATLTLPYAADSTGLKDFSVSLENYQGDYMGDMGRYVIFQSVAGEDSLNYVILDNVRLEPISNCKKVNEATISAVTADGATYSWENVGAAQYEVLVSTVLTKSVDTIATPAFTATVDSCYAQITGLEGNTQYYAYVRSVCGEGETGEWSSAVAFHTECEAIASFPWLEDFNAYTTAGTLAIDCWTNEHIAGSGSKMIRTVTTAKGGNATGKLELEDESGGNIKRLSLPYMEIPEANAYEFRFDMYRTHYSSIKSIEGFHIYCQSASGIDTLGIVPREIEVANKYVDAVDAEGWYTYGFTIPAAGGLHILVDGVSEYGAASYADNFEVRALPQCENPKAITVDSITETSARVHWSGSAAEYEFILMNGNALVDSVILTDTVYTFSALESGSSYAYTLLLRGICGADSSEVVTKSLNFNTVCGVKSLPFAEDFENYKSGTFNGACWTNVHVSGTSTSLFSISTSNASSNANGGGKQTLQLPDMQSGTITHLTSPEFDIPAGEPVELSIDVYRNATGSSYTTEGVRLFALHGTDSVELGFLYRNCTQTDGGVVTAESKSGWYTYVFQLPDSLSGTTRFLFQGESKYGSATYLDNFKLREVPTCFPGSNLHAVDSLTSLTTVGFGWTPNSADNLNARVVVKDGQRVVVDSIISDTVFTLTGLEASHRYNYAVEVYTICGDDESADAVAGALTFNTECTPLTAPWSVDFADATSSEIPVCWTVVKKSGTYPYISTSSHAIYMYGGGATSDQMVALPEFTTPLNKLTLTMQYQASVTSSTKYGDLTIGTLDETMAESSFVALATLPQTASKTDYELVLSAASADAKYLAIRYADGTSNYGTAYIYKMALELTPSCLPLNNLEAKNVERRSMDIVWTPKAESDSYDLVISTVALTDSALNVAEKISLDTTAYHLDSLTRNTVYYIYVRANCGAEDGASTWSAITQKTAALQECYDVAIADGTSTSSYFPFYGLYADLGFWTQMIYPESMLTDFVGSDLNSLKFYISSGNVSSWTTAEFQIALATTTSTEYLSSSDIVPDANLTLVYEGTVSAQNNVMTINFDQPFHYTGGNLAIDVYETVGGGYESVYFKGASTTNYQAFYTTDFQTMNVSKFLPKVSFTKCVESAPCPAVETVSHELLGDGTSSARIAWTASTGDYTNSYSVVYADSLITDWTNVVPQIDSIQALDTVISGLNAYTDYYVYVIAHCDAEGQHDGSSVWSEAHHFKTLSSCLVVEDLSFVATGKTSAQATWSAPYADKNFVYVLSTELLDEAGLEAATPVAHTDTVLNLESLTFDQTYYLYVAHNCGTVDGLSPYMMDSIHTSASCPAVANLHAVELTANTVTLAWNHAAFGEETEWEVGVVGRESVAQVVTDSTALIIGLDADMNYTVYVKAICSETEQSALATLAIHTKEVAADELAIGSGSGTSSYLPGSLYYKYAASMQIYTAEEIGKSGMITSLSLKYISSTAVNNRNLTIYLKHLNRSSFADGSDWETMDASEEVFSGLISYVSGDWTTIELASPFDYNGTDNLLLVVDDNTGGYISSGLNFAAYTTSTYQAIYYQADGTNFDPTNPTQSGTRTYSKNQILLGFEPQACPAVKNLKVSNITTDSATVSWMPGAGEVSWAVVLSDSVKTDAQLAAAEADTLTYKLDTVFSGLNPDTYYHVYVRSLCSSALAEWKHLSFTTLPTCIAPIQLGVKEVIDTAAVLVWKNLTPDFTGSYEVAVGKAATFNLAVDSTYTLYNASDTAVLVDGLEALTSYKFAVREHCSGDDNSRWSAVYTFRTECGAYDVPYAENFENADMTCWSLDDGVSVVSSSYAQSGTYALRFNKTNDTVLAVLPSFLRNLSELEFSYAWRCEGTGSYSTMGYLEAGYVTDPNDASTFVQLLNHPEHVYSYESADVLFPANVPDNARPAFRYTGQTGGWYLFVDDVLVREKPSCSKPLLTAVDVTPNTITVAFEDSADYVVEVAYDATFTRRYDSLYVAQIDTLELTGLPAATTFYIRALRVCDADMRSDWSAPLMVVTGCLPVTAFPWIEDFDSYSTGDYERPCVDNIAYQAGDESGYGSTGKLFAIYTTTQYGNSTPMLQLPDQKIGTLTRLYLPEMVLDTTSLYEFTMDIYRASASSKFNEGIRLFVVDAAGVERELTFISRDYATAGALVPAESKADWYTYSFPLPNDGGTYRIMLQGESQYGAATYMDNFMVVAKNANCLGVENVVVSNVSLAGADLAFNYVAGSTDAVVELATVADFSTVLASDTLTNDSTYHFANLSASTTYYVRVKQFCGEGEESAYTVASFTTNYGVRYAPVFASTTLPNDWTLAGGKVDDVIAGREPLTTSSKWSLTAANSAINAVHFKANVYGTSTSGWFITPAIDLSPNAQDGLLLTLDAALTDYYNLHAPEADKDRTDDRFVVVAIVDDTVFTKVAEWNNTGTGDYVYSEIDSVATPYMVDMTAFAGLSNVRLGFYCESTVSGADDDLHIGNIVLDRKDAVNYIGDICEGEDYNGAAEGNSFYIHASEYTIGENRFVKVVGDSICILSLTVYPNETEEYNVTVCEGEDYHDEYFDLHITLQTNPEQMNRNTFTEHGCTKTVIMHLTINPIQRVTEQALICPNDTMIWNDQTITGPGNYIFETKSVVTDCDSIITLQVKWGETIREDRDTLLHVGETFTLSDGRVISEPGTYTEELETEEGVCSHTITWHVTYEETALEGILDEEKVTKMVIDDHVVIIRNGVMYSVDGTRLN